MQRRLTHGKYSTLRAAGCSFAFAAFRGRNVSEVEESDELACRKTQRQKVEKDGVDSVDQLRAKPEIPTC